MSRDAAENVFGQVGHCGIWCGSCAVGTGALMDLAIRYRDLCESHGLGAWGADGFDYAAFLRGLGAIAGLAACPGCRRGGGREACEIRACANSRSTDGCALCGEDARCPHTEILEHMRRGARDAGLFVQEAEQPDELTDARRREILASLWWWRALHEGEETERRVG